MKSLPTQPHVDGMFFLVGVDGGGGGLVHQSFLELLRKTLLRFSPEQLRDLGTSLKRKKERNNGSTQTEQCNSSRRVFGAREQSSEDHPVLYIQTVFVKFLLFCGRFANLRTLTCPNSLPAAILQ